MDISSLLEIVGMLAGPPKDPDEELLATQGWIPLGTHLGSGEFHWTTLARGLGGAVNTKEAARIAREALPKL